MKKLKLLLSMILIMSTIFAASVTANAQSSTNDVISKEEYIAEINKVYSNYGITCCISDAPENFVFTKNLLNQEIQKIENNMSKSDNEILSDKLISSANIKELPDNNFEEITPYAMYITHTYSITKKIISVSGKGYAHVKMQVKATIDDQNGAIVSINSVTSFLYNKQVNVKSWVQLSKSSSKNNTNHTIYATVTGRLTTTWTDPVLNITYDYIQDHTITNTFNV